MTFIVTLLTVLALLTWSVVAVWRAPRSHRTPPRSHAVDPAFLAPIHRLDHRDSWSGWRDAA